MYILDDNNLYSYICYIFTFIIIFMNFYFFFILFHIVKKSNKSLKSLINWVSFGDKDKYRRYAFENILTNSKLKNLGYKNLLKKTSKFFLLINRKTSNVPFMSKIRSKIHFNKK